jgi:hypothetical protein
MGLAISVLIPVIDETAMTRRAPMRSAHMGQKLTQVNPESPTKTDGPSNLEGVGD